MTMRASIESARVSGPLRRPDGSAALEFRFREDAPVFAGHFPGRPLLPGVFQLEIARVAAELILGCKLVVGEICKAKFVRPISPGETLRVDLKCSEQDGSIQVRAGFSVGGQPAGEALLKLWRND